MPKKEFNGGGGKEAYFIRTLDGHRVHRTDSPYDGMPPEDLYADLSDGRNLQETTMPESDGTMPPEGDTLEEEL